MMKIKLKNQPKHIKFPESDCIPSKDMVDKQAFSIVNKDIHFGLISGFSFTLSFPSLGFICLQLTRSSWTFKKMALDVDSASLTPCEQEESFLNAKSLEPMDGALTLEALVESGFTIFIRKRMQLGESIRRSSWPCDQQNLVMTKFYNNGMHANLFYLNNRPQITWNIQVQCQKTSFNIYYQKEGT